MKKLAVVILNWNGKKHLETFLPSVVLFSERYDIIVIDNCSTDDSVHFITNNYPDIKCIFNSKNEGFAKGYNDGLAQIKNQYSYYVLLNSDVEVTENWITPCLNLLEQKKEVVGCQPKILDCKNKTQFEHAGAAGGFIDKNGYPFCRGRIFDAIETDKGQYNDNTEIFWATGACLFIKAPLFHEIGGFDADYFAHMEEIDLCWRMKLKGNKFYYVANSTVYHLGGGTLSYMSPQKLYLNFRNSLITLYKNYNRSNLFFKITTRFFLDYIALAMFLIKFDFKSMQSIVKAHVYFFRNFKSLKKKRKNIQEYASKDRLTCVYSRSIVWDFFLFKMRTFKKLAENKNGF